MEASRRASGLPHGLQRGDVSEPRRDITLLLKRWQEGDEAAGEELWRTVYEELRIIARRCLRAERPDHTFQATEVVNEAYFRLAGQDRIDWQNRAQFYALAATSMRRILTDHARRRLTDKRGAGQRRITLNPTIAPQDEVDLVYLLDLDNALSHLEIVHPRQARVAELKTYVALKVDEIAALLDIAPATVKRDWAAARRFLDSRLNSG